MAVRLTAEARRRQLLDAAALAIVEHGVGALRVRDVAEAAGVSQPLVSAHFRSRDELVLAAFIHADEQAMIALEARSREAPDARTALRLELLAYLHDGDDPVVARSFRVWQEVIRHGFAIPGLDAAVSERETRWIERIRTLIGAVVADEPDVGAIDLERTAVALNALADGLSPAVRWGYVAPEAAAAVIEDALVRYLPG